MKSAHIFTDKVRQMQPYTVQSSSGMIKLDAMESPYQLPEDMRQAFGKALSLRNINRYPNPYSTSLAAMIRKRFGLADNLSIILGNGSDELIQIIIMAVAKPGAKILSPVPSFVMYQQVAQLLGLTFIGIDVKADFSVDEDILLAAIKTHQPAVVFLANPNNPTGQLLSRSLIEAVIAAAPGLVVVDEAYSAYASDSALDLVAQHDHAILMMTLSKIGLAGIRLGYLAAHPTVTEHLNKVRMPYNISILTQSAAHFMLDQMHYIEDCVKRLMAEKQKLYNWLSARKDLVVYPSETNFLLIRVADANDVFTRLRDDYKILVKNLHDYHLTLDNILRITIGNADDNEQLRRALAAILATCDHGLEQ